MKLNIKGCRRYCKRNGITNYVQLADDLELSVQVLWLLERGVKIGYDAVRDIYNKHGAVAILQIIDFEGVALSAFESKYIRVGNLLH